MTELERKEVKANRELIISLIRKSKTENINGIIVPNMPLLRDLFSKNGITKEFIEKFGGIYQENAKRDFLIEWIFEPKQVHFGLDNYLQNLNYEQWINLKKRERFNFKQNILSYLEHFRKVSQKMNLPITDENILRNLDTKNVINGYNGELWDMFIHTFYFSEGRISLNIGKNINYIPNKLQEEEFVFLLNGIGEGKIKFHEKELTEEDVLNELGIIAKYLNKCVLDDEVRQEFNNKHFLKIPLSKEVFENTIKKMYFDKYDTNSFEYCINTQKGLIYQRTKYDGKSKETIVTPINMTNKFLAKLFKDLKREDGSFNLIDLREALKEKEIPENCFKQRLYDNAYLEQDLYPYIDLIVKVLYHPEEIENCYDKDKFLIQILRKLEI